MKKTIDHTGHDLVVGSVLRRMLHVFENRQLTYDTMFSSRCNDVLLGEVDSIPHRPPGVFDNYMERVSRGEKGLFIKAEAPRPGLIAVAVGNRYAPHSVLGGLHNPITGRPNGIIRGGSDVYDLGTYNLVGFINHVLNPKERGRIKVLGTLLDHTGKPLNTEDFRVQWTDPAPSVSSTAGILVCGSGMDTGKTSCCTALARGLRSHGFHVTFEKKTGTGSFRDSLRTCLQDREISDIQGFGIEIDYDQLPARDFVESAGWVSDVSGPTDRFVENSMSFTPGYISEHQSDVHIVELADNLSHRNNLALLRNEHFRRLFKAIVYVPDPSFDSAHHFLYFLREALRWHEIPVAFSGPVANESQWVVLKEEIAERMGVPCLPSLRSITNLEYDTDALPKWALDKII